MAYPETNTARSPMGAGYLKTNTAHSPMSFVMKAYDEGLQTYRKAVDQANGLPSTTGSGQDGMGGMKESVLADIEARRKEMRDEYDTLLDQSAGAIDPLAYSQYYPNSSQPLSVGTYQGSTFSAPILAPTFLNPVARRDAIEKSRADAQLAAMETRMATEVDFSLNPLSNVYYTDDVEKKYYSELNGMIDDYMDMYGSDWESEIMRSTRFKDLQRNFNNLVDGMNKASESFAEMQAQEMVGDIVITPETRRKIRDFQSGTMSFDQIADMSGVSDLVRDVNAESSLQKVITNGGYKDMMKASIDTEIAKLDGEGGLSTEIWETRVTESIDMAADAVAEELANTVYSDSDFYTKDYIKNYLVKTMGTQIKKELNQYRTKFSGGGTQSYGDWADAQRRTQVVSAYWQMADNAQAGIEASGIIGGSFAGGQIVSTAFYDTGGVVNNQVVGQDIANSANVTSLNRVKNFRSVKPNSQYLIVTVRNQSGNLEAYLWDRNSPDFTVNYVKTMDASQNAGNRLGPDVFNPSFGGRTYAPQGGNSGGNSGGGAVQDMSELLPQ